MNVYSTSSFDIFPAEITVTGTLPGPFVGGVVHFIQVDFCVKIVAAWSPKRTKEGASKAEPAKN